MTPARPHLSLLAGLALTTALTLAAAAQTPETPKTPEPTPAKQPQQPTITRVFPLKNVTQAQDANEMMVVLRTVSDPHDRIILMPTQNAIVMDAPADHIANAEKVINELDKPKKTYRLTYTLIDLDGTKRLGDQHYAMVLVSGQRAVLKQGNKVPIITGTDPKNPNNPQSQVTYLDVGMNFDATLDDATNALRLRSRVEQSSVLEDRSGAAAQDPVIRQSVFEGSAILTPGKPLTIGSLDITGTSRRIEIQVTVEPLNP
jgi:type II secretory pathway component GspD/PulD (secretin)